MKKLLIISALIGLLTACNSNSEKKITEDSVIVDKMDHPVDSMNTPGVNDTSSNSGNTGSNSLSDMDREFVTKVAMANTAEVQAGQLASSKGNSAAVKEFGDMMVKDHTDAQGKLRGMAGSFSLNAPDSVDAMHKNLKAKLMKLSGAAFDKEYIESQVKDHQDVIALFEKESSVGGNGQLKQFASATLSTLRMHLEKAQALQGGGNK